MTTAQPDNTAEKLAEICLGNAAAIEFCWVFLRWVHWLDDMIDGDQPWTLEQTVRVNLDGCLVFSGNAFFQRHREGILPLVIQAVRAWVDSEKWKHRALAEDRVAAEVMKSFYHEVFWHVGLLAARDAGQDGWAHMARMTEKFREFDYELFPL